MLEDTRDFLNHLNLALAFTGAGDIGIVPYNVQGYNRLRLVVEGVDTGNEVKTYGRLKDQSAWTLLDTITGLESGASVDIEVYDEVRFEAATYQAAGSPKLIVSGMV